MLVGPWLLDLKRPHSSCKPPASASRQPSIDLDRHPLEVEPPPLEPRIGSLGAEVRRLDLERGPLRLDQCLLEVQRRRFQIKKVQMMYTKGAFRAPLPAVQVSLVSSFTIRAVKNIDFQAGLLLQGCYAGFSGQRHEAVVSNKWLQDIMERKEKRMAAKGFALSDKANRWDVLITNGNEHVPEVPHIAEDLQQLGVKSAEARVLISRGDDLRAQARENTRKLRELIQEGEKIRSRVGLNLQARYGIFNEKLVKFGFQPRREARRKSDSEGGTSPRSVKEAGS